jgi:hypothetical protein
VPVPVVANSYSAGGAGYGGPGGDGGVGSGGGVAYGSSWEQGTGTGPISIGSGGATGFGGLNGGDGGGYVRLDVAGTLTVTGTILANGGDGVDGGTNGAGGGSGGGIYITTGVYAGTGVVSATGGIGGDGSDRNGGGGGGGRILVEYTSTTLTTLNTTLEGIINANGGAAGTGSGSAESGDPSEAGGNGTAMFVDVGLNADYTDSTAYIFDGFRFQTGEENGASKFEFDTIYILGTTASTDDATIYSTTAAAEVEATTATISNATWNCSGVTSLALDFGTLNLNDENASDTFGVNSGCGSVTINASTAITSILDNLTITSSVLDWNFANDITITDGAITMTDLTASTFTMDDAINVTIGAGDYANNTSIVANVDWSVSSVTLYGGSSINADGLGAAGGAPGVGSGTAPGTVEATYSLGGAGHGGAGGIGGLASANGGGTYGSNTAPVAVGSGGAGNGGSFGGDGGGAVRLIVADIINVRGSITVDGTAGAAGTDAAGGGSGGSIYIVVGGDFQGNGTLSADGGVGGAGSPNRGGGGGGGGRVSIQFGLNTGSILPGMSAANVAVGGAGGSGTWAGSIGTNGTYYEVDAGPSITDRSTIDNDGDGTIDFIRLIFTENVTDSSVAAADFELCITADGGDTDDCDSGDLIETFTSLTPSSGTETDTADDNTIYIGVSSSAESITASKTDYALFVEMVAAVQDSGANNSVIETAAVQSVDLGIPVITSFTYQDSDANGKIDQVLVSFSETVEGSTSLLRENDITIDNVGDFTSMDIGGDTTDLLTTDVSSVTVTAGAAESTVVDTSEDSGSLDIRTRNAFVLQDAAGNINNTLGIQSQATYIDGAGPVLVSSSPEDADAAVTTLEEVVLTFSETMDTGVAFVYTCCGAGTDPGLTGAWTVSDTVYTITPTSPWTSSEDITIDIIGAPDAYVSQNNFAGVVSGMNDPFTFTIASPSGGGTPTPGTGPAAVVTTAMLMTPNGAEVLQGNAAYEITWLASGDNLDTISIYYSANNGSSYELVISNEPNDGSYTWTVPNETVVTGKIRVDAVTSSEGVLIDDESNSSFSITSIIVSTEPATGEPELTGPVLAEMTAPDGVILDIREGSLFRGVELSGVYLVKDGTRYVFPSEAVFLSRYADFSGVVQVDDDQLRELPFGGRMTMAQGSLIKIQSDNRVYVVLDDIGTITHIPDEATAISTYGADWAQLVHDISVVFWFDYTQSSET